MTILEKVELQKKSNDHVFLFKEGLFYKVYNQGIFHLHFLDNKVGCRFSKAVNDFVLSIGFPDKVLEILASKYKIEKQGDYLFFKQFDKIFDIKDYQEWKVKIIEQFHESSIMYGKDSLVDIVKSYPLGSKTPVDVFIWVSELQKKILEKK
jgi:hypothetical protein